MLIRQDKLFRMHLLHKDTSPPRLLELIPAGALHIFDQVDFQHSKQQDQSISENVAALAHEFQPTIETGVLSLMVSSIPREYYIDSHLNKQLSKISDSSTKVSRLKMSPNPSPRFPTYPQSNCLGQSIS
jgi:hypothetical protein